MMQQLIERYNLQPHPEGGYYREVYRSPQTVLSPVVDAERQAVTHIYFLLTRGQISRFHRVRHDEIWNFYEGAPLRLVTYNEMTVQEQLLGPGCATYAGIVEGGLFQAAETTGDYSLMGCSVAPGFDFADFSFLADVPELVQRLEQKAPAYRRFL
ncbi:MAG: cupin domain-containing protein [Proteobacteria bacterium]|nr:cupin domain-containing protein [Pseudomonadota bacterium]